MAMISSSAFHVQRNEPELLAPSKPTPYELKYLSDHDDHKGLWKHIQGISIVQKSEKMEGRDPVKVIKQAIADALVYYYPLAGRLREEANGKFLVECTGEGVMFIEATANVTSDYFAQFTLPPVPGASELLYQFPGSTDILHAPVSFIQVTRLQCGGFTFAMSVNHTMCDAQGFFQFLTALNEMAGGAPAPSINPVWERHLLNARDPLQVSCVHHVFHQVQEAKKNKPTEAMAQCSLFFGPEEISILRNQLQPQFHKCSKFDILAAVFWKCHTMALNHNPEDIVHLTFAVNARNKINPPLPVGYYGNAYVEPVALSTAGELCKNSFGYALELVRKAKDYVTDEFVRSTADYLVKNGRPNHSKDRMFHVSDLTALTYTNIDFGMGKSIYAGTLNASPPTSYFISAKNNKGVQGIVALIGLPAHAMNSFVAEIVNMLRVSNHTPPSFIVSNL